MSCLTASSTSLFTLISSSNASLSSLIFSVLLNIHMNLLLVVKMPMSCSAHTSLRPSFNATLNAVSRHGSARRQGFPPHWLKQWLMMLPRWRGCSCVVKGGVKTRINIAPCPLLGQGPGQCCPLNSPPTSSLPWETSPPRPTCWGGCRSRANCLMRAPFGPWCKRP